MKFNNSYRQIKKNPVVKELIPFLVPIFQKGLESEEKYDKTNIDILERIVNILVAIEQIYSSIELLSQEEKNIEHHIKYSIYLIEDILFRFTSIFDKCLHLSNMVHITVVSFDKCREYEDESKGDAIKKALKELNKFTHNFRVKRKKIASSGCFSEPELDKIQAVFFLFKGAPELHEEQLNRSKRQLKEYFSLKSNGF
ncbi:MAG: hypothetical protein D3924_02955 [Candidatus Electrothrix sp. AR4]|nr:hypothetical protein [Candidatus Electrothrix sp. AR4]